MRLVKVFALLFVIALTTNLHAQKPKMGHVNSDELLQMMPGLDTVQQKLQKYTQDLQKEIQNMQAEYDNKVQDYMANEKSMSNLIKQTKQQEITELESRIQAFSSQAQQDIQQQREKLLGPIIDRAKQAIEDVAKENGYTYVLDSSPAVGVVLYGEESQNIMPLVKKELGLE